MSSRRLLATLLRRSLHRHSLHQILHRTRPLPLSLTPPPHFTCYTTYSTSVAAPSLPPPTAVAGSHDGKITDKFIGASVIRQVCEVIGVVVDVGFS
ncbi:putative H(+)-transporting two-sector ATPase [Helianthus anomalus]